jgi:hypothetical protein
MNIGQLRARHDQLMPTRNTILDRAREAALVTIPYLYPLSGTTQTSTFPTPWQSHGARCVNNLSSKLLLSQFPPNTPFFRLVIDESTREQLGASAGDVDKGLAKIERAVMQAVETGAMRPGLAEALRHLVVSGNVVLFLSPKLKLRVFPLHQFVQKRDPEGTLLELIIKESVSPLELPDSIRQAAQDKKRSASGGKASTADDVLDLYTGVQMQPDGRYRAWQEVEGIMLPNSMHTTAADELRFMSLRWCAIDGEDYGRGYVEQYLGDFKSLEGLQQAIVEGAAAASRVLFLVRPNSTTKMETLAKAPNGAVESGNADDVSVVQMEKYSDFRVALEARGDLLTSLSYAFLLNSAVQRDAERVTAEEIRYMVSELEASLGGVYATLSQELQLPFVTILMQTLTSQGKLPQLPKGVAKPAITTGVEALGRGNDANRMRVFFQSFAGLPDTVLQKIFARLDEKELISRNAAAAQIDEDGLMKSDAQMQQDMQQALAAQMAVAGTPNAVRGMVDQSAAEGAPA